MDCKVTTTTTNLNPGLETSDTRAPMCARPQPHATPQAMRGMEAGLDGWDLPPNYKRLSKEELTRKLRVPNPDRMICIRQVCTCVCASVRLRVVVCVLAAAYILQCSTFHHVVNVFM